MNIYLAMVVARDDETGEPTSRVTTLVMANDIAQGIELVEREYSGWRCERIALIEEDVTDPFPAMDRIANRLSEGQPEALFRA